MLKTSKDVKLGEKKQQDNPYLILQETEKQRTIYWLKILDALDC